MSHSQSLAGTSKRSPHEHTHHHKSHPQHHIQNGWMHKHTWKDSTEENDKYGRSLLLDHLTHHVTTNTIQQGMLMIVDGLGLALINGATIWEGFVLWREFFHEYWITDSSALSFWISGRACQVVALSLLIAYAATFQLFEEVEKLGMWLLTLGPILNMIGSFLFDSGADPTFLFNKQWFTNEILELTGIIFLDCSYIEQSHLSECIVENIGFAFLIMAATLEFDYALENEYLSFLPAIEMRFDFIHGGEGFGLFVLALVSISQYRIKVHEEMMEELEGGSSKSDSGSEDSGGSGFENNVDDDDEEQGHSSDRSPHKKQKQQLHHQHYHRSDSESPKAVLRHGIHNSNNNLTHLHNQNQQYQQQKQQQGIHRTKPKKMLTV